MPTVPPIVIRVAATAVQTIYNKLNDPKFIRDKFFETQREEDPNFPLNQSPFTVIFRSQEAVNKARAFFAQLGIGDIGLITNIVPELPPMWLRDP